MDISPNYAATIYGFASGLGNSAGFFLGLLMDYVIEGRVCSKEVLEIHVKVSRCVKDMFFREH